MRGAAPPFRYRLVAALFLVLLWAACSDQPSGPAAPDVLDGPTAAVLVVGSLLGARDGALTLTAYLIVGGIGVPVFAGGGSGWAHFVGPTAGYLLGFVAAAAAAGRLAERGLLRRFGPAIAVMICGHALILALGWLRLAWMLGATPAFWQGVAPFVMGGMLKSLIAAVTVMVIWAYPDSVDR